MPPKVRCTNVQKRVMCEYMAAHTLFANGEYSGPLGATRHEAQWRELAGLLKEYGPDKPVQAWKTTWRDVKRKARGENAAARKAGVATGNMCDIPFVGEEVGMVLSVIGEECSVGIGPQESGIGGLIHTQGQEQRVATGAYRGLAGAESHFGGQSALCRRARREGIDVGRNSPGNRLVRMYGALALLPPARVPAAVAELPRAAHTDALPFNAVFQQYFMDYWMTTIGPECFSVHGRVHRTSNVAESYHASLGRPLGAAPNIWRFTQVMMEKFNICATRRRSQLAGNALPTRRNRVRQMVRAALVANNLAALRRGAIRVREFLVLTSRSITAGLEVLAAAEVPEAAQEVEVEVERERDVLVEEEHLVLVPPAPIGPDVDEQVRAVVADVAAAPQAPRVRAPRCNVCLEPEALPTRALSPCGHTLCGDCLLGIERAAALQDRRCPFCRAYIRDVLELFF